MELTQSRVLLANDDHLKLRHWPCLGAERIKGGVGLVA